MNPGDTIARMINLETLRVEALVDGNTYGNELVGRAMTFVPASSELNACEGRVVFVSPELHPVTGQVRLVGEIQNPDGVLRAGMKGSLAIK